MKIRRNPYDSKIVKIIPENDEEYELLYEWWTDGVTLTGGGSYTTLICTKYIENKASPTTPPTTTVSECHSKIDSSRKPDELCKALKRRAFSEYC